MTSVSGLDPRRYYLGKTCRPEHTWGEEPRSLRLVANNTCVLCTYERLSTPTHVRALDVQTLPASARAELTQRLMATIERVPHGCWLWTGPTRNGYGVVYYRGSKSVASRLAYALLVGPVSAALQVCHSCDALYPPGDPTHRRCINPAHLFLDSASANQRDKVAKGRQARGARHGMYTQPQSRSPGQRNGAYTHPEKVRRGEDHVHARLSEMQVIEIRTRYAAGETNRAALARAFGVSKNQVERIVKRRAWTHI